ncbi:MAG: hypothetical protein QNI89_10035 [Desulfobacterales bacterium]|nr:hypothetical protein [Desulfobacterales bacterium]MDJ0887632.1 hypothetical protein [Desulfobacterales bacterium]
MGRDEFVHASTIRGVMISRLDEHYWRRSFWKARRVLDRSPGYRRNDGLTPRAYR